MRILPNTSENPTLKQAYYKLKFTFLDLQKKVWQVSKVNLKAKALRHFKVHPVLKINAYFQISLDLCGNHFITVHPGPGSGSHVITVQPGPGSMWKPFY